MANIAELVGILAKRVAELEHKNGLLLSAVQVQNIALKGVISKKANHADLIKEAEISVNELLSLATDIKTDEADKEAA